MSAAAHEMRFDGLPHQREFWLDETTRELAMVGPLGCGKSYGLAVKALLLSMRNPRSDGILLVPTYAMGERTHKREWPEIFAAAGVAVRVSEKQSAFVMPWGRVVWVISAEEPDRMKSINAGFALCDEPGIVTRDAYDTLCSRVRHPAAAVKQIALGGTPEGINWFADLYQRPGPGRRTIWARGWHASLGDYRAKLEGIYGHDESLAASYVGGKFVPLGVGRAYAKFDPAKHVAPCAHDPHVVPTLSCDFNVHAMRWVLMDFLPREIRAFDEIALGRGSGTEEAANEAARRLLEAGCRRVAVTGDAAGQARSTTATRTDYQIIGEVLRAAGVSVEMRVPASNPAVRDRAAVANYHLSGRGGMAVVADPRCRKLIRDLEAVAWREGSGELDKRDPELTHASDAWSYAVCRFAPANVTRDAVRIAKTTPSSNAAFAARDPIMGAAF